MLSIIAGRSYILTSLLIIWWWRPHPRSCRMGSWPYTRSSCYSMHYSDLD